MALIKSSALNREWDAIRDADLVLNLSCLLITCQTPVVLLQRKMNISVSINVLSMFPVLL